MRWALVSLIRLYRCLPPRFKSRRCLYRESCSSLALRIAQEEGFFACCSIMKKRFAGCRPNYQVIFNPVSQDWQVRLADGTAVGRADIAEFVLEPYPNLRSMNRGLVEICGGAADMNSDAAVVSGEGA